MDYDEGNRGSHAANVGFVVRQMRDAAIKLLRYTEGLLVRLHKGTKGEAFHTSYKGIHLILPGAVYYDATLFK